MHTDYPEYSLLAARIAVSNLHKQTKKSFLEVMTDLRNYVNPKTGRKAPLIAEDSAFGRPLGKPARAKPPATPLRPHPQPAQHRQSRPTAQLS